MRNRRLSAHKSKLQRAKSLCNVDWSRRELDRLGGLGPRRNGKREQLKDDREEDIKRENMRMLLKMQKQSMDKVHQPHQPQQAPARSSSLPEIKRPAMAGSNNVARMQELRRIDTDNKKLLTRLRTTKPSVNLAKMESEFEKNQKVMQMRRAYPDPDALPSTNPPIPGLGHPRYWDNLKLDPADLEETPSKSVRLPSLTNANAATGNLAGRGCPVALSPLPGRSPLAVDSSLQADDVDNDPLASSGFGGSACSRGGREALEEEVEALERYGLVIPNASRLLSQQLLDADDKEREAEQEAADAKEAAARAMRDATAVEVCADGDDGNAGAADPPGAAGVGVDLLSYENVVRRCQEAMQRRK